MPSRLSLPRQRQSRNGDGGAKTGPQKYSRGSQGNRGCCSRRRRITGRMLQEWMARRNLRPATQTELDDFDLIIHLVALGLGVSLVPHRAIAAFHAGTSSSASRYPIHSRASSSSSPAVLTPGCRPTCGRLSRASCSHRALIWPLTPYAAGVALDVVFEETPTFTRRVTALLNDASYADLQHHLVLILMRRGSHPRVGRLPKDSLECTGSWKARRCPCHLLLVEWSRT